MIKETCPQSGFHVLPFSWRELGPGLQALKTRGQDASVGGSRGLVAKSTGLGVCWTSGPATSKLCGPGQVS